MQRPRRIVTILTVLALSISLGACGTAGDRKQEQSSRGQASAISGDVDANAADASYRDEIAKIKNSGSTEAAQILEDGKITEEELVQLGSSYAQCLTSKGITVDTGEARYPGGSISPSYGDNALDKRNLSEDEIAATNAADEACQNETQYKNIVDLYLSLKENPENVDTDQLARQQNDKTLACLKKHGIVDDSVTADAYDELATMGESGGTSFDDLIGKYAAKRPSSNNVGHCDGGRQNTRQSMVACSEPTDGCGWKAATGDATTSAIGHVGRRVVGSHRIGGRRRMRIPAGPTGHTPIVAILNGLRFDHCGEKPVR